MYLISSDINCTLVDSNGNDSIMGRYKITLPLGPLYSFPVLGECCKQLLNYCKIVFPLTPLLYSRTNV